MLNRVTYNSDELSKIRIGGVDRYIPRKQIAFGDPNASYGFSGARVMAYNWDVNDGSINGRVGKQLKKIRSMIESYTNKKYNYVLVNKYRDGNDYVGYHSDDEKELGEFPTIVGLSFGQERYIYFKSNITKRVIKIK